MLLGRPAQPSRLDPVSDGNTFGRCRRKHAAPVRFRVRHGSTGKEKRQSADDKNIVVARLTGGSRDFGQGLQGKPVAPANDCLAETCEISRDREIGPFPAAARTIASHPVLALMQGNSAVRLDHHQINATVFEAFPCQTIPRHLLYPVPILT